MPEERRPRALMAAVAGGAALAVAVLVAAAASSDRPDTGAAGDDRVSTTARSAARTTTTVDPAFPSGDEWSIVTAVVAPDFTTTTALLLVDAAAPPASGPPPVSPPAPGAYTYRETASGATEDRTYRIEDRPPADGEQRAPGELQFLVTLESAQGSITTRLSWRIEGAVVLESTIRMPAGEAACDWDPDWMQLPMPLSAGLTWSYESSCTTTLGAESLRFDRRGEFTVEGDERIAIAGGELATWRMAAKETNRVSGALRRTDQEIRTYWLAPKYGITVREHATVRQTTPSGVTETARDRELVSLRPLSG